MNSSETLNLIYARDQRVPLRPLLVLALQHTVLMASSIGLPATLMQELGSDRAGAAVALTMIAAGFGTILQSVRLGPLGSGYLCPNLCGPNFFAAAAGAAWTGGWPLMRGMSIFSGTFATACAFAIHRLRRWFPPEVIGVVFVIIAAGLIPIAMSKFVDVPYVGDPIVPSDCLVGLTTLVTMILTNASRSNTFRLNSIACGIAAGYASYYFLSAKIPEHIAPIASAPWFGIPHLGEGPSFAFQWSLVPTFMIVAICGMLKSFGNLSLAQTYERAEGSAQNLAPIRGGLVADGIAVAASGLIGGLPTDTSASNVALSAATGATSRYIGMTAGALFIAFGFCPKLTAVLASMPPPIAGAVLLFVTCLIFASGVRMLAQEATTVVKPFAVGLGLIAGLSAQMAPALYADLPVDLRPIAASPLSLATIAAIFVIQVHSGFDRIGRLFSR